MEDAMKEKFGEAAAIFLVVGLSILVLSSRVLADAKSQSPECRQSFLSTNSSWSIGRDTKKSGAIRTEQEFSPVISLAVSEGEFFAETWGGEPKPVKLSGFGRILEFTPRYIDPRFSRGNSAAYAAQIKPYTHAGAKHRIVLSGSCAHPSALELMIEVPGRKNARYIFARDK